VEQLNPEDFHLDTEKNVPVYLMREIAVHRIKG
jgi:hypothetical protein